MNDHDPGDEDLGEITTPWRAPARRRVFNRIAAEDLVRSAALAAIADLHVRLGRSFILKNSAIVHIRYALLRRLGLSLETGEPFAVKVELYNWRAVVEVTALGVTVEVDV